MQTISRYFVRPVAWALALVAAAVVLLFLLWLAQGPGGPGPNTESTTAQQVGIWGERVYVVGSVILAVLVIRRRLRRSA